MNFQIKSNIQDALVIQHNLFTDNRGYFTELFKSNDFKKIVPNFNLKQINFSFSKKNVFRGMHIQTNPKMSKAMMVLRGEGLLLAYNMKNNKFDFKKLISLHLKEGDNLIFWAPYYYARGFISLSNNTYIQYFCDGVYSKKGEYNFSFNTNLFNISNLIKSEKDASGPTYKEAKKIIKNL